MLGNERCSAKLSFEFKMHYAIARQMFRVFENENYKRLELLSSRQPFGLPTNNSVADLG